MKKNISLIIVIAALLFFCFLNLYLFLQRPLLESLIDSIVSVAIFAILSFGLQYSSKYILFSRELLVRFLISHFVGAIIFTAIWLFPSMLILKTIFSSAAYHQFILESLPWRYLIGVFSYFLAQGFIYLMIYYDRYASAAKEESELKNLVTESELRSLKFQLNPHFLFNSLNSISALSEINPTLTRTMTIKLSEYLRSTLSANEKSFHSFEDELNNILLYVDIEKIRFADKFIFSVSSEADVNNFPVPNMILQPIIENAIKYGTLEAIEQINIVLSARIDADVLILKVENDFYTDLITTEKKGTGTGLENIRRRLFLTYKRNDLLKFSKSENKCSVEIKIPRVVN